MAESRDIYAEDTRTAARMEAEIGAEHVADVYAKGLLSAAAGAGPLAPVLDEFDDFVRNVLDAFPKLDAVLASQLVSHEEKTAVLDRVLGGRASPVFLNFLKVVSRHGRLDCLRAIHCQTHEQYDQLVGRVRVELTTAAPLDAALQARIVEKLRAMLGGEPIFQQATDPELIGGAVLRIGDTVYDGSIANQLTILREQMIDRSVHEIQSRRDRFRNSAGN